MFVIRIRKDLKLTQLEFAQHLGIDRRTIINYEQGGKIPESKVKLINMVVDGYFPASMKPSKEIVAEKKEVLQEDKMREISDLKDHISTLKQFLEEKNETIMYKQTAIDKLKLEIEELKVAK
ncbi:helix-turn-helix domain-containing protein [Flavobacterium sp. ACAM 123]|uniref:helix-turn-helix domain-containing protein n=1 Tax=Flavobacterium sp. ACAM 123 TaxID=1189620 RepID=UPI0002DE2C5E|nr:helix-turn-helix transcriptional regulator [Flavobacterium sp. ACAM 123]